MPEQRDEQDERYFLRGWSGGYLPDFEVADLDSKMNVALYRCRDCAALTDSPLLHETWHERRTEPRSRPAGPKDRAERMTYCALTGDAEDHPDHGVPSCPRYRPGKGAGE